MSFTAVKVSIPNWRASSSKSIPTEAVLHALAAGGSWDGLPVPADLALSVMERWERVEAAMDRWRAFGISATHEDVERVYIDAAAEVSGRSRDEIYDELLTATERADA